MVGRVEGIYISTVHGALPAPVDRVEAVAGAGLRGNRHFYADGGAPPGRALTLIAAEALEAFEAETGMTRPGVIDGMVHRAGLNADVLTDGEITVGDAVAEV